MNAVLLQLVACWAAVGQTGGMPPNAVFENLVAQGVPMPSGTSIKLPPPIMSEAMTPDLQAQELETTVAAAKSTTADFLAKNTNAPMLIKIQTLHTDPTFRTVDIAFVARGKWSVLTDPNFGKNILKGKKAVPGQQSNNNTVVEAGILTKPEMATRGLQPKGEIDNKDFMAKEGWMYTTLNLFSQAQVSVTRHVIITRGPTSALFAALLDPKVDHDAQYPNQWRTIDAAGVLGSPQPYKGAGFYVKVVKLAQPQDAIFCEYHSVFYEPHDWFGGTNELRSKLPTIAKYQAQQFRRKLAIASEPPEGTKPAEEAGETK